MRNPSRTSSGFRPAPAWLAVLALALAWASAPAAEPAGGSDTTAAPQGKKGAPKRLHAHRRSDTAAAAQDQPAAKPGSRRAGVVEDVPSTLDRALAAAMENNPDVVAAQAKVQLAEAELNRARMEVARKVIVLWTERQGQQQTAERTRGQYDAGTTNMEALIAAQSLQAQSQAELRYLTGRALPAAARSGESGSAARPPEMPLGPLVEKTRKALNASSEIEFTDTPISDILSYLADFHKIDFQGDWEAFKEEGIATNTPISASAKRLPLAAVLQLLEDQHPPMRFVVRDYGLLLTTTKRAQQERFFPAVQLAHQDWDFEAGEKEAGPAPKTVAPPK
jgi:hypothetical protein